MKQSLTTKFTSPWALPQQTPKSSCKSNALRDSNVCSLLHTLLVDKLITTMLLLMTKEKETMLPHFLEPTTTKSRELTMWTSSQKKIPSLDSDTKLPKFLLLQLSLRLLKHLLTSQNKLPLLVNYWSLLHNKLLRKLMLDTTMLPHPTIGLWKLLTSTIWFQTS